MTIADLVVGRSDGVAYPNNNLDYKYIRDAMNFCNKRDCTTCKYETYLKCNSPCNLCSLNPEREDNWKAKVAP